MLTIPNMTKAIFKKNIIQAIEMVLGNPIKHKRDAIANRAMTTVIFGNDITGTQHNAEVFFSEDKLAIKKSTNKEMCASLSQFQRLERVVDAVEGCVFYSQLSPSSVIKGVIEYCKRESNYYEFILGINEHTKLLELTNLHLASPVNGTKSLSKEVVAALACNKLYAEKMIEHMQGILPQATLLACSRIAAGE